MDIIFHLFKQLSTLRIISNLNNGLKIDISDVKYYEFKKPDREIDFCLLLFDKKMRYFFETWGI